MQSNNFKLDVEVQRHFPSVKLGDGEIVLAEYETAARRCEAEERAVTITNGLVVGGAAALLPVVWPLVEGLFGHGSIREHWLASIIAFLFVWLFVTSVLTSYICDLRRSFVFAARKVIVIRRMLGQSYGRFSLVLPTWRLEGADQPFSVRLFPGWRIAESYSFYATIFLSSAVTWLVLFFALWEEPSESLHPALLATSGAGLWTVYWMFSVRRKLYDTHETFLLSLARIAAGLLRVRLHPNIHYLLYRAQLSATEGHRLGLNFELITPLLIFREDRRFFAHRGIAVGSMARAAWDWLRGQPSGGASTISQQLARSIFVRDLHKRLRRKLVEIILARWLEQVLTKSEILESYLMSVRYDKDIFGFIAARRHFFGGAKSDVTKAEALVLIERISNIRSLFRGKSINRMLSDAIQAGVITQGEAASALKMYDGLLSRNLLHPDGTLRPPDIANHLGIAW